MRRSLLLPVLVLTFLGVGGTAAAVATHTSPLLGLDLRGGASVVLQPARRVGSDILDQTINIIRNRVDALGVAEPNITRQGNAIDVELPGVKDTQRALNIVGKTAQLTFRPVVGQPISPTGPPATTPSDKVTDTGTAVLAERDSSGTVTARYQVGPVVGKGTIIKTATAAIDPNTSQWLVNFVTTSAGNGEWDAIAQKYYQQSLAIVLDDVVVSAPTINSQHFGGRGQITGNFTEQQAKDLALELSYGALPVQLKPLTVQTVSATLGKDSLRAGLAAAVGGLILVLLYIVLYYRALGVVAFVGLALTGLLLWPIISYLGKTSGLALTLAGVTGIIVSIGITVDSYIVYFERLKDEIRSGKTIRSSVDRGFARAFRTIVAADAVSFIGALLLYLLTVGPVRGFAFFLGLSTLLDVFTSYFFTRPLVILLGRNRLFTEARWMGVARGLAAPTLEAQ
ncbi:MAG TPA: protein translocase subunit SecD [Acidimicrobiales bacterium]|nr:protein translocase subunit SecD [Acidimicrobiales bacterium]